MSKPKFYVAKGNESASMRYLAVGGLVSLVQITKLKITEKKIPKLQKAKPNAIKLALN